MRADDFAAVPLRALMERNPEVDFARTEDVMMGAAAAVGEQGYNVGRIAGLLAGFDHHVPATTVNRFCASSLQTIRMAFHAIKAGEGDQYVAAGVESVSRTAARPGGRFRHPKLAGGEGSLYDVYIPMGQTAENVAERCGVTREAQDEWAALSQQRAVAARDGGHFDAEIVPVTTPDGTEVTRDDGPRPGTTAEVLAASSPPSARAGRSRRATPARSTTAPRPSWSCPRSAPASSGCARARIIASAVAAIRPEIMGLGPIPAVRAVLERAGMTIDDVDVVEINEAFAAQVLPCRDELGIDPDKLNPFGGAIALGHPFGMTGARIMTTLLNGLEATDGTIGVESMCVAGGMGQAMVVERLR